jgi:hypothetical protein
MTRNGSMIALYVGVTTGIFFPLGCSSNNDVPDLPLGSKSSTGGSKAATGGNAGFPWAAGGTASTGGATGGAPPTGGTAMGGLSSTAGAATAGAAGIGGASNPALNSNSGGTAAFGGIPGFGGFGGIPVGGGDSIGFGAGQTGSFGISTGGSVATDRGTGGSVSISSSDDPNGGCNAPGLIWKTGRKTNYESYPDPNSEECIEYHGCDYVGEFAACPQKHSEAWVQAHNIASVFPHLDALALHDLCVKSGNKTIVVTVLDACADTDCEGCCTENRGNADELIDLEKYTNQRFGVEDGPVQWADLGPTKGAGCQ